MTRRKKILISILAGIPALILVLIVASILIIRTAWFQNYVREKIVAAVEDSTGGVVEIGSFRFDWTHLTATIQNFVLHGTEPKGVDPLASAATLELRLSLFSGVYHLVDLNYLGIDQPRVNLIVFPDGKTNIPQPKIQTQPSQTSGLETVVDLKIGQFEIKNGLLEYSQRTTPFSARGENLRALLAYNIVNPSYQGNLRIDPLILKAGSNPQLGVHINVPIVMQKDAIQVNNATLNTAQSQVQVNASMQNMNAPQISAKLNATLSVAEMQKSLGLPINAPAGGLPSSLSAELAANYDDKTDVIQIQTAHLALGATTVQASGTLDPAKNSGLQFNANFALTELSRLLDLKSVQASGALVANGNATLDAKQNYSVNGTFNSRNLSVAQGTTRLKDMSLYSPFHADPYLISLDGLRLNALGGTLVAKIFVEKLERLSIEGSLHGFSLPVLANAFTGKRLAYDGVIGGSIKAQGDLKAKGTTGYRAAAHLAIMPGNGGVPVSGMLDADYVGATGAVDLHESYVELPHSRMDVAGSLNKQVNVNLISRNLNDFLPAINFGSTAPQASLPLALQNRGTVTAQAQITGNLSDPRISSHVAVNRFAVEQHSFNQFAADVHASQAGANIQTGVLNAAGLQTKFSAEIGLDDWKPLPNSTLAANLTMHSSNIADLLALAGESSIPASGDLNASVHVNGTYGDPLGSANLQVVNGSAEGQPFDHLTANVNLADRLITLSNLELAAAGGRIDVSGTFRHPRDSFMVGHAQFQVTTNNVQLANVRPVQQASPGVGGAIQLTAAATADIRDVNKQTEVSISNVTADLSAGGLRVQNQQAGNLTATARTVNGAVRYKINSEFAGSSINVNGTTALADNYATTADASIQNLSVAKALQIAGQGTLPAQGNLSVNAHVAGTLDAPNANLTFALTKANVYQEPIHRVQGSVEYTNTSVNIPSLSLEAPAGSITVSGSFSHPAQVFNTGSLQLKVDSSDIQLAKFEHIQQEQPSFSGALRMAANVSARLQPGNGLQALRVSILNANIAATNLRLNDRALGQLALNATSTGSSLNYRLDSDIAQSQIHASGQTQLAGDYDTRASLTFANIRYANIAPFISEEPAIKPSFDASLDGQASLNGPLLNTDQLTARLQMNTLDVKTVPKASPTGAPPIAAVDVRNQGPIVVALNHSVVQVQQFHLQGPGTNISAAGAVNLKHGSSPLGLTVAADANLGVLQDIDREFYSSGTIAMNATVRGNFSQPLINGRVELKKANLNYMEFPTGISNANAVIALNGTNATIQSFNAESGGGKVALSGFAGYTGLGINFNLKAAAHNVRVRYAGVSATSDANIAVIGTTQRSLVEGTVTVNRIVYGSTADTGTLLSFASAPPSTPSAPSPLLSDMRLDIHVRTAADLNVVTTYANRLDILADLTVRGTAEEPGVLGRVVVTDGQLVFFGNTYTVNVGTVNFYNPNSIQPILNLSLETIAQNVDVTLGVTGPVDNLHLTYSSDPPLTFEQIVSLLATNTTPSNPMIAAQQPPPPTQSTTQLGESALLGEAIANPLANRVQRVFGLTQFQVSPTISGTNGQASARVTLQQKISTNLTFTYINDVTQSNAEIIRVDWAFTDAFTATAMRDYNGNVSVEFFYKFKRR